MKKTIWDKRIDLREQGMFGHFWKINDRDEVIQTLFNESRVILGGEILIKRDGRYTYESSNWYYNGDSCEESVKKTKEYFATWSPSDDLIVEFVFKPDSKQTQQMRTE